MKIKAEQHHLGNGEILQNRMGQLPAGGVTGGSFITHPWAVK